VRIVSGGNISNWSTIAFNSGDERVKLVLRRLLSDRHTI
jgi:hypothetical protein